MDLGWVKFRIAGQTLHGVRFTLGANCPNTVTLSSASLSLANVRQDFGMLAQSLSKRDGSQKRPVYV